MCTALGHFLTILWTKDAGKFVSSVAKQTCKPTLDLDTVSKMVRKFAELAAGV